MTNDELTAAVWATLGRIAGKETRRDALMPGTNYPLTLQVKAKLNGQAFSRDIDAHTAVGSDSERVATRTPDLPHLVACLLARMNRQTRAKVLGELPEQFARADNRLPPVEEGLVEAAGKMLERLRAKVRQQVRGAVSTTYRFTHPQSQIPNP